VAAAGLAWCYYRFLKKPHGNFDEIPLVDGFYIDPIHAPPTFHANIYEVKDPWMGGVRFFARKANAVDEFIIVGCDDNIHWWALDGRFSHKDTGSVVIDFGWKAPRVGLLRCLFRRDSPVFGSIAFLNDQAQATNVWPQLTPTPEFEFAKLEKMSCFNDINSLYVDPAIYKKGSLAGVRVITDRKGKFMRDEIVIVGTDDGKTFWTHGGGRWTDKIKGKFCVGPYAGSISSGDVTLSSGATWTKMTCGAIPPRTLCDPSLLERPSPLASTYGAVGKGGGC